MKDLTLDPFTHDLLITNFDLSTVDDVDQITQNLGIRLRFFLGEWFLNIGVGVPFYQSIFVKSPNQINVESAIKNEIINTIGISEILSFASQYDNRSRQFALQFSALSDAGPVIIEQSFP
jgi:hypothetical protein